jgi:hypothetical protein
MNMTIEQRVTCILLVGRYLRALKRFEEASEEFNGVCQACRSGLPHQIRFITQCDYKWYIVTTDADGSSFEVDPIDAL